MSIWLSYHSVDDDFDGTNHAWDCDPEALIFAEEYDEGLDEEDDKGDWQVLVLDRFGDRAEDLQRHQAVLPSRRGAYHTPLHRHSGGAAMNRPDPEISDAEVRLYIAVMILIVLAAWCGFPWQAFAQPFPVLP